MGNFAEAEQAIAVLTPRAGSPRAGLFWGNLTANIFYDKGLLQDSIAATLPLIPIAASANELELQGNLLMNTGFSYTALDETD